MKQNRLACAVFACLLASSIVAAAAAHSQTRELELDKILDPMPDYDPFERSTGTPLYFPDEVDKRVRELLLDALTNRKEALDEHLKFFQAQDARMQKERGASTGLAERAMDLLNNTIQDREGYLSAQKEALKSAATAERRKYLDAIINRDDLNQSAQLRRQSSTNFWGGLANRLRGYVAIAHPGLARPLRTLVHARDRTPAVGATQATRTALTFRAAMAALIRARAAFRPHVAAAISGVGYRVEGGREPARHAGEQARAGAACATARRRSLRVCGAASVLADEPDHSGRHSSRPWGPLPSFAEPSPKAMALDPRRSRDRRDALPYVISVTVQPLPQGLRRYAADIGRIRMIQARDAHEQQYLAGCGRQRREGALDAPRLGAWMAPHQREIGLVHLAAGERRELGQGCVADAAPAELGLKNVRDRALT